MYNLKLYVFLTMKIQNLENKVLIFNFVFGLLVVAGGVIGYVKADSLRSLVAGLFFGNLLMVSIWLKWGNYLADIVSISLLIFFIMRLINTGKFMPAVLIIVLASMCIVVNTLVLHQRSLKKS